MEEFEKDAESTAESSFLKRVLDVEEYNSLNENVIRKVEDSIQESLSEFLTRKALFETSKIQHEQELIKLQEECKNKTEAFENASQELEKTNSEIKELVERLQNAQDEVSKVQEINKQLQYEWKDFKTQRDLAVDEKESLLQMVNRRNSEITSLKSDVNDLTMQLQSAIKAKMLALESAEEVESLKISLTYKERRLEQESNLLKAQIQSLNDDLNRKTLELTNLRQSSATRAVSAEADIAEKTQELNIAHKAIADLQDANEKLNTKVQALLEKLVQQRNDSDQMFDNFQQEVQSQTKLAQLYKGLCDENESKTEKLTNAISELQQLLKDASEQYGELETKKKQMQLKHEEEMAKKNECLQLLRKELHDANELLRATKEENIDAAMATLSPCAAAASRLIKSGMTLTQIYTQYATVSEQLLLEKEENRRLQLYVTTILNEIEEKAPILRQQRLDYEKAVNNVESLTKQMDEMITESKVLHHECAEAKKTSGHLSRENERLKKELADLGRQVCYLIKAVEESRGGIVTDLDGSQISYDGDGSSAQHVISKKLVTFGSIQDLQENNQKLLALVRQLSAKHEASENISPADYHDLKSKEERLQQRVKELMDDMDRQSKMLELIKNQSLTYKSLYEQALSGLAPQALQSPKTTPVKTPPSMITSTPKTAAFQESMQVDEVGKTQTEHEEKLKKAREEVAKYKTEVVQVEKRLTEQLDKMRSELNEWMYKNSKLVAQAEYHEEKCKILETNFKSSKKQVQALEERNKMLSEINAKHEQSIIHLKDEAMSAQGKLSKAEVTIDTLKQENFLLQSAEARLVKEREAWNRERHSHSLLMSNLDAIKATFERSEAEGKLRLEMQLSEALKECSALRNSLQSEKDRFKELAASLERQTATAKERMLEEKNLADKAREDLLTSQKELNDKCKLIDELNGKIRELSNQPTKSVIESVTLNLDESAKKIKELEKKMSDLQHEISSLNLQLTAAKQHSAQYCEMAETLEKQLNEANEEHEMFRNLMTEKIEDAMKRENELRKKTDELEQKCNLATKHQKSSTEELNARLANSSTELRCTSTELINIKQELDSTLTELTKAKDYIISLESSLQEAESKYSNEVVLHSSHIQTLTSARKELEEASQELTKLRRERDEAAETLKVKAGAWEEQEKKAIEEVKELNKRLADLDEQNVLLHEKIQELGNQVAILQAKVVNEGQNPVEESTSLNESMESSTSTQDQLLKVIRFIRQEKDVAVTKSEILQSENTRLKTQLSLTVRELEEAKETIKRSAESAETAMKTSAKHAELLRKIETLNAVTDSNRMLREERDKYKEQIVRLKDNLTKAEARLAPLSEEQKKLSEKVETLSTENQALMTDVARWKQKAERSNKATPEDWRRLTNERENLAKQWQLEKNNNEKLEDELRKVRHERTLWLEKMDAIQKALQTDVKELELLDVCSRRLVELLPLKQQLIKATEELQSLKIQINKANEETTRLTALVATHEISINDLKGKEIQLKKIAKKYKTQYEELMKSCDEEKRVREEAEKKRAEEEATKPLVIPEDERDRLKEEGRTEVKNDLTPKIAELENKLSEKIKEYESKIAAAQEESEALRKDNENLKTSINEKEERAKQVIKGARSKIVSLTEQKNSLEQELKQTRGQSEQNRDENDTKYNSMKTHYESIIAALEKERSDQAVDWNQERERFSSQMKSLNQRLSQVQRSLEKQQGAKPSTSSRPADKSTMEPPTANIKPMAGASSTQRKQKQTTAPVGPCWRSSGSETPFASIRPTISLQTRTLAVQPRSQTSNSEAPSSQGTQVMVLPRQQIVHTTGNSGEALSSSPTSSHTDYMPATSSATPIRQVVVAPPLSVGPPMGSDAQSTQEMEAEANDSEIQQETSSQQSQSLAQQQQTQTVAMVLPRERVEQQTTTTTTESNQQQSIDQSCAVAYSQANSSNTVTTTQAGLKRPRDVEGDSSTGLEGDEMSKASPQSKRTRVSVTGSQAEVFHHQVTHSEGIEVEYQVPTSSQRDQEDDMIIMVDSEEEGNADEGDAEEPDDEPEFEEDNGEGYEIGSYSRDGQDIGMTTYDEGPDIDEENVPDQDNNEVEVIEDSNEVPNQSGSSRDGVADNGNATQSSINAAVPVASSIELAGQDQTLQQSSEATSSGPVTNEGGSNIVVVSHAASSQPSQTFRSRNVPPLSRQQQSQLILPQNYEESGDDSIVPSTPTLFIPRRADGFGEAVSSPQVPHQARFTFSDPSPPITRSGIPPASGEGCEDVIQLEEPGTGRSVPTTPLQVSPQELPVGELVGEVGQSSSGTLIEGEHSDVTLSIPDITVTAAEDDGNSEMPPPELSESAGEEEESNEKGDTSGEEPEIINLDEDNDGVTSEGEKPPTIGEIEEGREAEASEPFDCANPRRPTGRVGGTARRSGKTTFPRRSQARRPTPIVWNEPGSSSGGFGSAIPSVVRTNVPTVRMMTPELQRLAPRGRMSRMRHRTWR